MSITFYNLSLKFEFEYLKLICNDGKIIEKKINMGKIDHSQMQTSFHLSGKSDIQSESPT